MDNKRTYSRADIARELKRPRSTVSYWIEMFSQYLPSVGSGRNKRYTQETLSHLRVIEQMKDRGEPNEVVEEFLQQNASEIIYEPEDENRNFYADIAESYKAFYEQLMTVQHDNERQHNELKSQLDEFRESNEQRQNELERQLIELKETNRQLVATIEEDRKKGFFQRLFGK